MCPPVAAGENRNGYILKIKYELPTVLLIKIGAVKRSTGFFICLKIKKKIANTFVSVQGNPGGQSLF